MKLYYKILEVTEKSTLKEIKKSYRRLSKLWHPDKHQDPEKKAEAEQKQSAISEAYAVLGSTEKRLLYDTYGINCSIDKIKKAANEAVSQVFRQLLKVDFRKERLFSLAQESVLGVIGQIDNNKVQIEKRIDFLNEMLESKVRKKMAHLGFAIREEISSLESNIQKVDFDKAVQQETLNILKKIYKKEDAEESGFETYNEMFRTQIISRQTTSTWT